MIDFILNLWDFPSLIFWLVVFPLGLTSGFFFGWLTGALKDRFNLHVGYSRKIFHFFIFSLAGITGLAGGFQAVQVFGAAIGVVIFFTVMKGKKNSLFRAIARPSDEPHEKYYIIIPFLMTALGGMTSNILFGKFALIGYLATGWGDALGEPVGTRWGRHKYRVPTLTGIKCHRSLEGSMAIFLASFTGSVILLFVGFDFPLTGILLTSLCVAASAAVVESVTFHSLDNLTIQVVSSGVGWLILKYF